MDWRGLNTIGVSRNMPITLDLQNQELSAVISAIVDQTAPKRLQYDVVDGIILVSSVDHYKQFNKSFPAIPANGPACAWLAELNTEAANKVTTANISRRAIARGAAIRPALLP